MKQRVLWTVTDQQAGGGGGGGGVLAGSDEV